MTRSPARLTAISSLTMGRGRRVTAAVTVLRSPSRMTKVSAIVPVFNPGSDIDDCIDSLLGQTLPAGELELIFVDDGSTDGTPARLDELAARHGHVKVQHIPNSGWPGKPRNLGIDMATGEYVFFVDNDDWLERDALERVYAMAVQDRADIVIGKVVGHGRTYPRRIFESNLHAVRFDSDKLLSLLTPHKLFRRRFLDEHGLRFPEGKRRLEDHPFVVSAYFSAERISVLADHPIYHWVRRERRRPPPRDASTPPATSTTCARCSTSSRPGREPGPERDALMLHWYRGKMLKRVGGRDWLWREEDFRRELFEAVRPLALERFGEEVHERLPFNLRLRSKLLRRGDYDALGAALALRAPDHARGAHPRDRAGRHAPRAAAGVVVRRAGPEAALRARRQADVLGPADRRARRRGARGGP